MTTVDPFEPSAARVGGDPAPGAERRGARALLLRFHDLPIMVKLVAGFALVLWRAAA